jgi:hydroxymethylcytosylglucuronate/cytosylglucuronate synthase
MMPIDAECDSPHVPAGASPITLFIAGVEFGWGSAGKLAAILTAVRARSAGPLRVIGLDSELGRPVLSGHGIEQWRDISGLDDAKLAAMVVDEGVTAAVVVLDPGLAERLEAAGCPVVYVDSLPFLWTRNDPVPRAVTRYCAQRCRSLSEENWAILNSIENLRWVGGVVGVDPAGRGGARSGPVVVNFGGLRSPHSAADDSSYLALLVPPLLGALRAQGWTDVVLTGNIDLSAPGLTDAATDGLTVTGGSYPFEEFTGLLAGASLVLTSPGRTTMLELAALGQHVVVLPPQNISQIYNGADAASLVDPRIVVPWPLPVLDPAEVERDRGLGEEEAVRRMYRRLRAAAGDPGAFHTELEVRLGEAIAVARTGSVPFTPFAADVGIRGAEEIAEILAELR